LIQTKQIIKTVKEIFSRLVKELFFVLGAKRLWHGHRIQVLPEEHLGVFDIFLCGPAREVLSVLLHTDAIAAIDRIMDAVKAVVIAIDSREALASQKVQVLPITHGIDRLASWPAFGHFDQDWRIDRNSRPLASHRILNVLTGRPGWE